MFRFWRYLIVAAACLVAAAVLPTALQAQNRGAKIEIQGVPAQINPNAGSFVIEGLTVETTLATKYEDGHDRKVNKEQFFADFKTSDRVEVEGYLSGNVVTAHEIEIKHQRSDKRP